MTNISYSAQEKDYYIGLMSGTSADGVDLALVTFDQAMKPKLHASYYQAYSNEIANKITSLYNPSSNEVDRAFELDVELAHHFSQGINALLKQANLTADDITAIGNHGQTIRHRPQVNFPFTLQIGCSQTLATLTDIRVIGQFRRKDMALGGQGAPLVPAFHEKVFSENSAQDSHDVFVVNIGGITNITFLPASKSQKVVGYDTGPGNALMDDWFQQHNPNSEYNYDRNGDWAATGKINSELLTQLNADDYFALAPPKSTGREYFNISWLENHLSNMPAINKQDVQTTLTAFTAQTLVNAIEQHSTKENSRIKVYLCGGGAHNTELKELIKQQLDSSPKNHELLLTNQKDIDGDQLEAIAFAWLAFAYDKKLLSSMSAVTGASKSCTLGVAFFP